jgi:NAD(P)-dependent dehydrogenase (short-subunit alcohol dehydrogenase family)
MMTFDITDEGEIVDAVDTLRRSSGTPSGVVCSAGYQGTFAPLHRYPSDELRRVVDVNLVGLFLVLVHTTRLMVEQGIGGAVVNLASMAGVSGAPNMPAYSAAKPRSSG